MNITEILDNYSLPNNQVVCYLLIAELYNNEPLIVTAKELGERLHCGRETVSIYLSALSSAGLIIYHPYSSYGLSILWVRTSLDEKKPDTLNLKRKHLAFKLLSPEQKTHQIMPGQLRAFCSRNDLNYNSIKSVLNGYGKQHRGWMRVS